MCEPKRCPHCGYPPQSEPQEYGAGYWARCGSCGAWLPRMTPAARWFFERHEARRIAHKQGLRVLSGRGEG